MTSVAVEFYERKFQEDVMGAFLHRVREVGSSPAPSSKTSRPLAVLEITEIVALMEFLASRFGFDLAESVTELYTKKQQKLTQP
ncbi:MAG: hypothetical protein V3U33_02530 [candidate division NC10 bacterium]